VVEDGETMLREVLPRIRFDRRLQVSYEKPVHCHKRRAEGLLFRLVMGEYRLVFREHFGKDAVRHNIVDGAAEVVPKDCERSAHNNPLRIEEFDEHRA